MIRLENTDIANDLFGTWQEGCIWSAMQGIMGEVYVDDIEYPSSGVVLLGDFVFLAGSPNEEMVRFSVEHADSIVNARKEFRILVPEAAWQVRERKIRKGGKDLQREEQNADLSNGLSWDNLIETCYGKNAQRVTRYGIKKEKDIFDKVYLKKLADAVPQEYAVRFIDAALFEQCGQMEWCRDGVGNFPDYALFEKYGLGVVALHGSEIAAICSSYSGFEGGIEVEVVTRQDYRQKGLATVCAANLLLKCLQSDLLPSWDAANLKSLGLCTKLGYHFDREYISYELCFDFLSGI